ncbi:MAG: RND family efflux transporter MFP subunit [Acidobacteria bacterium OLB17]|nr:MAG: RND family efflux transporter MFP subunit [Acidobacteria bacterium OLB17]MCZ2391613.1 efflux RND transporter periplasmic adaptor subunit [Acidobacteriota bacterium]
MEMKESVINDESGHHQRDEAELNRLEANLGDREDERNEGESREVKPRKMFAWILAGVTVVLIAIIGFAWMATRKSSTDVQLETGEKKEEGHTAGEEGREVRLDPETLAAAGIETEAVTQRPAVALLDVTGSVEADPQRTQAVSPLVAGRVEQVFVAIGDRVSAGQVLASIASTEVTEAYGKFHEAENRLDIARKNLDRIRRAENRVNILQAKARLDEAEATLKRTRTLIELGAGAGKDLIAAETAYKTAQADYDFQRNIPLNKEIQEAEAEVKTAQIDVNHQRRALSALGINVDVGDEGAHNIIRVPVRAPLSGTVSERLLNAGSGVQAGQQMFTLSNISSVWITANVPQQQLGLINIGSVASVKTTALGEQTINARVTYIDPGINEDTRTAKVRLAVDNPGERLRPGMFVEVGFQTGTSSATGEELVVKSDAIQRVGEKTVVFVPKENEPGAFEVREVEAGGEIEGYTRIRAGLQLGEKVVTKGSFVLKTQLQKGELGEE